jgi:hypothetical protein
MISKRYYPKLIEEFMPSEEMKEYLKNVELIYWQIVQLVYLSPTTIAKKKNALKCLLRIAEQENDDALLSECQLYLRNIADSERERTGEGVFTVKMGRYCHEEKDSVIDFETVCTTYDAAISVIVELYRIDEYTADDPVWYEITKWNKAEDGKMSEACSYIIVRGELWYIDMDDGYYDEYLDSVHLYYEMENLNVPVPFLPGDILEIDGYPFGPVQHILITDIGDNCDCCCVQALSINEEGKWTCGAVKHGMVGYRYFPKLSPLYNAKIYEGSFDGDEALLSKLRDYLSEDRSKAKRIYDCFFDEATEEEMMHFIEMDFDRYEVEKCLRTRKLTNR